jgi:hypothetical protein
MKKSYDEIWIELQDVKKDLYSLLKTTFDAGEKYKIQTLYIKCENSIYDMEHVICPTISALKINQAAKTLQDSLELVAAIKARKAKVASVVMKNAPKVKNSSDSEYEWYSKMSEKELNDLIEKHGDI